MPLVWVLLVGSSRSVCFASSLALSGPKLPQGYVDEKRSNPVPMPTASRKVRRDMQLENPPSSGAKLATHFLGILFCAVLGAPNQGWVTKCYGWHFPLSSLEGENEAAGSWPTRVYALQHEGSQAAAACRSMWEFVPCLLKQQLLHFGGWCAVYREIQPMRTFSFTLRFSAPVFAAALLSGLASWQRGV